MRSARALQAATLRAGPLLALIAAALPAAAQDATWNNPAVNSSFLNGANWSTGAVPTGTAFFGASNQTTVVLGFDFVIIGGFTYNAGAGDYTFLTSSNRFDFTGAGIVINGGSATVGNIGVMTFLNSSTASSATFRNSGGGELRFGDNSTAANATIDNLSGNLGFSGTATAGSATITNNTIGTNIIGTVTFGGSSTAGNATIVNNAIVMFTSNGSAGDATITNNGSLLFFSLSTGGAARLINGAGGIIDLSELVGGGATAGSIEGAGNIFLGSNNLTAGGNNLSTTFSGVLQDGGSDGGTGGVLTKAGTGTLTLTGSNTYTGGTGINGGVLAVSADNNLGGAGGGLRFGGGTLQFLSGFASNRTVTLNAGGGAFDTNGNNATLGGTISGTGGLTKTGAGTLTLAGANTYAGATTVNAGALVVDGSVASSTLTTVNAGGALGGNGVVGNTTVNGGVLSPGASIGTLAVQGDLALTSAAAYIVEVSTTAADRTNVTGSAALGGSTVQAVFAPGGLARSYTILSAAGGLNGAFGNLTTAGLPAVFSASLSYTGTDAILNLTAALGGGTTLNQNQQNVANALSAFFNNGGTLPPGFESIFGLTGGNLASALTLLSGEPATGAQQGVFQLGSQFLNLMLDPFVDGRSGIAGAGGPALGFAPERPALPDDIALAYGKITKTPVDKTPVYKAAPVTFEQRWSVWGGAYGGYNKTNGDPAVVGSHDLTARTAGFAAGMDYRMAPGSVVGFALAGGGTRWDLAQGLGSGKSDAFQAGVYGAARSGPAYLAASLVVANHWMSTDRAAPFGDRHTADFDAQSYGARVEGGWRFGTLFAGITPYGAVQAQSFHTPTYSETGVNGGGFGLTYNSRDAQDIRSELGARFDHVALVDRDAVLTLRGRLAWAHDWVSNPALAAAFQALPGSSFIVNGATPAKDSALVSAGAELRLVSGVTLSGKFDAELARGSQTYAGTGTIRYMW